MSPMSYAGFWKRLAAYLIDKLLISAISLMIMLPVLFLLGVGIAVPAIEGEEEAVIGVAILAIVTWTFLGLAIMVMTWLYYALMESSSRQGTLGKMALGIIVTDMEGRRISFGRASGRYFGKIISDLTLSIGYIIAGFTEKKQALHDIMASCLVVNKEPT